MLDKGKALGQQNKNVNQRPEGPVTTIAPGETRGLKRKRIPRPEGA